MDFSHVSRQRTRIMGFAMIWIIFFHINIPEDPGFLVWFLHRIGFYGVDLFFLLSGVGVFFSLKKNSAALPFYKRRAVRVLPAYLVVLCAYYAVFRVSAADFLISASTVGYWLNTVHFDWFLPTLLVFYLMSPWYYRLFSRTRSKVLLTLGSLLVSVVLAAAAELTGGRNLLGSIVRIPVYLSGFLFGEWISNPETAPKVRPVPLLACTAFGFAAAYVMNKVIKTDFIQSGINACPALLLAPCLALLLGFVFSFAEDRLRLPGKILLAPFSFAGRYSLELYLIHERLMEMYPTYWLRTLLLTVVLSVALHELISPVIRGIRSVFCSRRSEQK